MIDSCHTNYYGNSSTSLLLHCVVYCNSQLARFSKVTTSSFGFDFLFLSIPFHQIHVDYNILNLFFFHLPCQTLKLLISIRSLFASYNWQMILLNEKLMNLLLKFVPHLGNSLCYYKYLIQNFKIFWGRHPPNPLMEN